jgi:hypothetical protein
MISTPRDYSGIDSRSVFGLTPGGDNNNNGVPGEPADQAAYNLFNIAEWTGQDYRISPDIRFQVGRGYFVRFGATATVVTPGGPTPGLGGTFNLNLPYAGWHIIGNPFDPTQVGDLDLSAIRVVEPTDYNGDGRTTYTMAEAVRAGAGGTENGTAIALVRDVVYRYTGSNSGSQYVLENRLQPWLGYWFRTFRPVTLQMVAPATRSVAGDAASRNGGNANRTITQAEQNAERRRSHASRGTNDWRLQIAARQSGPDGTELLDTDNAIGVAPSASNGFDFVLDNEKPPMITQAPSVYLAFQGRNHMGREAGFTDDIRAADSGDKTWEFTVESSGGTGEVTLSWPNINRVPRTVTPVLRDLATNRTIPMRSASSYRFSPDGRSRRFAIQVTRPSSLEFAFASVTTAPTRGGIQRFAFRTTRAADVQAEIQTLTGRTVRTLRTRTRAREESAITWDGRNEEGAALPAGPYMLSLTARDAEGNVIMVQRPVVRRN